MMLNTATRPTAQVGPPTLFGKEFAEGEQATIISNGHELLVIPEADLKKVDAMDTTDGFDWSTDKSVIVPTQLAVACYVNEAGALVIRQQRDWNQDEDTVVVVAPENVESFVDKLTDLLGYGGPTFGGPS